MEKLFSYVVIIAFLIPLCFIITVVMFREDEIKNTLTSYDEYAESAVNYAFSSLEELERIAPDLLYTVYPSQRDGIFITKNYLLEDVSEQDENRSINSAYIKEFSEKSRIPTYLAVVPTAIAIKQEELPVTAKIYNQKKAIEECYTEAGEKVKTVDTYSELFSVRDQYIYYRTEPVTTSLGGYYVYHAVMKAMKEQPLSINEFSVYHKAGRLKGSYHRRVGLNNFPGDIVSLYEYNDMRAFSVLHHGRDGIKKFNTLYPDKMGMEYFCPIAGGYSPRIEISSNEGRFSSLLVLGDRNSLSALPFLALDFENITFLDLKNASAEDLMSLRNKEFEKVLFCYDTESFFKDLKIEKLVNIM